MRSAGPIASLSTQDLGVLDGIHLAPRPETPRLAPMILTIPSLPGLSLASLNRSFDFGDLESFRLGYSLLKR